MSPIMPGKERLTQILVFLAGSSFGTQSSPFSSRQILATTTLLNVALIHSRLLSAKSNAVCIPIPSSLAAYLLPFLPHPPAARAVDLWFHVAGQVGTHQLTTLPPFSYHLRILFCRLHHRHHRLLPPPHRHLTAITSFFI